MNGRPEAVDLGRFPRSAGQAPSVHEPFEPAALAGIRSQEKLFRGSDTLEPRVLVLSRCLLAFAALGVLWVKPSGPLDLIQWTYASLATYCVYSVVLAVVSYATHWPTPNRALHWIDLCIYVWLVAISGGSFLFYSAFFFYPILVASFIWGSKEGVLVTLASVTLFSVIGLNIAPTLGHVEVGSVLIDAVFVLVFGIMIADLGGYERLHKRRLGLLKEITNPWSPRFGVDHVNSVNLDRLLEFYGAKSCVLVLRRLVPTPHYMMYHASHDRRDRQGGSTGPSTLDDAAAGALLRLPDSLAAVYHDPVSSWWIGLRGYWAYDFDLGSRTSGFRSECAAWANLLDAHSFVTVPHSQRDGTVGRIFVTSERSGFSQTDIEFLAQASDAMAMVVENMYLVEELSSQAVEHERVTISRDLHDTTIQPYIGLKLALDALQREAGENNVLSARIAEVIAMAEMTIRDLRDYASTLKDKAGMPGEFLVEAVKKQTERLERFYGIRVEVKGVMSPALQGRLAAEVFQIISEGLSNILRHTRARKAFITILCEETNLLLAIGNELVGQKQATKQFMPRSIAERVKMLGGKTSVDINSDGHTIVHVTIPI